MVSFLSSLIPAQAYAQEETGNGVLIGYKRLEEGKIAEEAEEEEEEEEYDDDAEEEEEEEGEEDYDGDNVDYGEEKDLEGKDEEDEEKGDNEGRKNCSLAEGRNEMGFRQVGGTDGAQKADNDDTSLQSKTISDVDTQKVKVSSAEGSSTWNKLSNELNALMKSLNSVAELSQVVQSLQSMHSIIRCAIEVVVLLESSCLCLPPEAPFVFTFFDDNFGDMMNCLLQVLSTSCGEEGGECVTLMCLEMVGTLLLMPEAREASPQDIRAALTVLSCPWHSQVPPGTDMNCSTSLVSQLSALSSKFSHNLNDY
jgi:hypothetical protein